MVALLTIFSSMLASCLRVLMRMKKELSRLTLLWNSMLISFYTKSYSFSEAQKIRSNASCFSWHVFFRFRSFLFTLSWIKRFYSKNDFTTFFLRSLVMLLAYHIKKRKSFFRRRKLGVKAHRTDDKLFSSSCDPDQLFSSKHTRTQNTIRFV